MSGARRSEAVRALATHRRRPGQPQRSAAASMLSVPATGAAPGRSGRIPYFRPVTACRPERSDGRSFRHPFDEHLDRELDATRSRMGSPSRSRSRPRGFWLPPCWHSSGPGARSATTKWPPASEFHEHTAARRATSRERRSCVEAGAATQAGLAPAADDRQEPGETPASWQRRSPGGRLGAAARCCVGRRPAVMPRARRHRDARLRQLARDSARSRLCLRLSGKGMSSGAAGSRCAWARASSVLTVSRCF
jgi:hypothetical protein